MDGLSGPSRVTRPGHPGNAPRAERRPVRTAALQGELHLWRLHEEVPPALFDAPRGWLALRRVLDALPEAALLCGVGGEVLHANLRVRSSLTGDDWEDVEASLPLVCQAVYRAASEVGEDDGAPPVVRHRIRTRTALFRVDAVSLDAGVGRRPSLVLLRLHAAEPDPSALSALAQRWGLTRAEARVARLLAARRSNLEIAEVLGCSRHTVRHHVEHIFRKLDVHSRTAAADAIYGRTR